MNKNAIIETLKSFGRFIWFGLLGVIVTALTMLCTSGELSNIVVTFGGVSVNIAFIVLAIITGIIKMIDGYIHNNDKTESNGIAPNFLQK